MQQLAQHTPDCCSWSAHSICSGAGIKCTRTSLPAPGPTAAPLHVCSTLKAIRMQESSKGRRLTPQERQELMRDPAKLLRTLLGPLGVLYSGLKPAAIETAASQAVSDLRQQHDSAGGESFPNARSHPPAAVPLPSTPRVVLDILLLLQPAACRGGERQPQAAGPAWCERGQCGCAQ